MDTTEQTPRPTAGRWVGRRRRLHPDSMVLLSIALCLLSMAGCGAGEPKPREAQEAKNLVITPLLFPRELEGELDQWQPLSPAEVSELLALPLPDPNDVPSGLIGVEVLQHVTGKRVVRVPWTEVGRVDSPETAESYRTVYERGGGLGVRTAEDLLQTRLMTLMEVGLHDLPRSQKYSIDIYEQREDGEWQELEVDSGIRTMEAAVITRDYVLLTIVPYRTGPPQEYVQRERERRFRAVFVEKENASDPDQ